MTSLVGQQDMGILSQPSKAVIANESPPHLPGIYRHPEGQKSGAQAYGASILVTVLVP